MGFMQHLRNHKHKIIISRVIYRDNILWINMRYGWIY